MTWQERLSWIVVGIVLASATLVWIDARRNAGADPVPAVVDDTPAPATAKTANADAVQSDPKCYLGVVLARETVDVASEMEGYLEQVTVRVGDRVERGQLVARLDTERLEHQLTIERANLLAAQARERRTALEASHSAEDYQRSLALEDLLSKEDEEEARLNHETAKIMVEAATAEVTQVEARIAQLKSTLGRTDVRAPFEGTVARRYLDPGARVSPGTSVVRLISSESLLTRFAVPPDDISLVSVDSEVRVEVETWGLTYKGTVEHVAPEIDGASQMVFVEAEVDSASAATQVPSGAVARVSLAAPAAPSCLETKAPG